MRISTSFDQGTANTTLPREGVDIGSKPDFWGDLRKMQRLRKRPKASQQSAALQDYQQVPDMTNQPAEERVALFSTPTTIGQSSFMQPWMPGMVGGGKPVFTGYAPPGYEAPRKPQNATFDRDRDRER